MLGDPNANSSEPVLFVQIQLFDRLLCESLEDDSKEVSLNWTQHLIEAIKVLLPIECLNDNSDEQIEEEQRDDEEHGEDVQSAEHKLIVFDWRVINLVRINSVPEDLHPTFCSHDRAKSHITVKQRIKVEVRPDPFATVAQAVPLG